MSQLKSKRRFLNVSIFSLALIATALVAYWQQSNIVDWLTVRQYPPSQSVIDLADNSYMNEYGSFLFFASRPEIDDSSAFSEKCGKHEHGPAVLGCFVNYRIYLFDIKEEELDGIREVTAAHEMLHAAYARFSPSDKEKVNRLVTSEIDKRADDEEFIERMKVYDGLSVAERVNEYHSIVGTEIVEIDEELESHYSEYFTDRRAVVQMYQDYSGVFRQLRDEATELADALDRRAVDINRQVADYQARAADHRNKVVEFNNNARGGNMTQSQFNQDRQLLLAEQAELNRLAQNINNKISLYEQDRQKLNGISLHLTELNQSIDSSVAPPPEV